jgi:Ca2+-dependent lipid-binding protein
VIDINTVVSVKLELYDADDIGTDDFLGYTQIDLPATNAYNFMKKLVISHVIQGI